MKRQKNKRAYRASIMKIAAYASGYEVTYRLLRSGPKRANWMVINAKDEIDAYMQAKGILERRGYRV